MSQPICQSKTCSYTVAVVASATLVGAVFAILASQQILPNGVNALSGASGIGLGGGLSALGLTAIILGIKGRCAEQKSMPRETSREDSASGMDPRVRFQRQINSPSVPVPASAPATPETRVRVPKNLSPFDPGKDLRQRFQRVFGLELNDSVVEARTSLDGAEIRIEVPNLSANAVQIDDFYSDTHVGYLFDEKYVCLIEIPTHLNQQRFKNAQTSIDGSSFVIRLALA